MELEDFTDPRASLMPLTDIHLHSRNLRELGVNGNIVYIWLVTGANVLLLIVVLFNLWFNSALIFSYNSGMYRLLRLHGAPVNVILRTEALQGLAMALAATAAGLLLTAYASGTGAVQGEMPPWAVCTVCMAFIAVVVAVSVVPAAGGMSMTYFLDGQFSGRPVRFSYKKVHRMISVQYAIVITVLVLSAGIAVWAEVYPDCESDFVPMSDIFRSQYRNELNARNLVLAFTLLCFLVADLGLIVFMAFIIRRRTREIAIRKINGATSCGIVGMLNSEFIRSIAVAFIAAAPVSWLILHIWLQRFAYRISLDWWLFAGAGIVVLSISLLSVSVQSWHAARANPADGIRK